MNLIERYLKAANRLLIKIYVSILKVFLFYFVDYLFETEDLQSCCGYLLAICQLYINVILFWSKFSTILKCLLNVLFS